MDSSDFLAGVGGVFLSIMLIVLLGMIVAGIMYLVTLRNAMNAVSPELRRTHPDNAFLLLIPLFNLVYYFIFIGHLADSLGDEMRRSNMTLPHPRPTFQIGLAAGVLNIATIIPVLGSLASIAFLVCWIIHWVQVADARTKILRHDGENILDQGMQP